MSKVIIFHGTDCKPNFFWYSWVKTRLEEKGHKVLLRHHPDINKTPIDEFILPIMDSYDFDGDTILIGHSAGVPLILSILERINKPIKQTLLIAGFVQDLETGVREPILQDSYDLDTITRNSEQFVFFNSPNDPWGCDDKQGQYLFDKLGGTLIIRNDGHFGSSKDTSYTEFPILLRMIGDDV